MKVPLSSASGAELTAYRFIVKHGDPAVELDHVSGRHRDSINTAGCESCPGQGGVAVLLEERAPVVMVMVMKPVAVVLDRALQLLLVLFLHQRDFSSWRRRIKSFVSRPRSLESKQIN